MKRIHLLRDVNKDGSYSTRWGIERIDWYENGKKLSTGFKELLRYRALCISFGTRDLIICYKKLNKKKQLTIEIVTTKDKKRINMLDGDTLDITNRGNEETDIFIEYHHPVLTIKNANVIKAERKVK